MINFLSSWVKNLSLALIVVSILEMILPNSKTKKYIKMVMGLYILFSIISPFIDSSKFNLESINMNFYEKQTETTSSIEVNQTSMDVRINQIYKEQLEKNITSKLKEKGYELENCKVKTNISENDSGIERITIKIKEKIPIEDLDNKLNENNEEEKDTFENKIVTEIEKIQKVNVKVSKDDKEQNSVENDDAKQKKESSKITKSDISLIKKFLIEEYGVSEKCLRIS
ncbi:MAG: stage III sporulation protein AF [Clostridia bacterium]|jgi:stage III sporulation protein AF|nr:stage III sporulation protein AF [Clostridia bacterium]